MARSSTVKTHVFTAVVVLSNVLGNFSLSWGLRRAGRLLLSPWAVVEMLVNPWVVLGVSLLMIWLLSHMALLSWADLSYVLPVTSVGYVLAALAGRFFLNEQISLARWAGIVLRARSGAGGQDLPPRQSEARTVKWFLVAVIVAGTTAGEVLQAMAMKRHGELRDFRLRALKSAVHSLARNRMFLVSIACMAVSFAAFLALLSVADLSFAVPVTAVSYVLETALAWLLLREQVGWGRWAGAFLVACGVALLSL